MTKFRSVLSAGLLMLMTTGAYAQGFAQRGSRYNGPPAASQRSAGPAPRSFASPGYGAYYSRGPRHFPARKLAAMGGGAAVGAMIGGATGKGAKGAAVGAVAGAIAGLVLESTLDRHHRYDW